VTSALIQRLDRELQERVGMDIQTYDVLLHLSEAAHPQRMSDLAAVVVLSKSGLTSLVDRIEARGLLERRPDPSDRRATRLELTTEGKRRFKEATRHHRDVVHAIFFSAVRDDEAAAIVTALTRVRAGLAGASPVA
jgi:DNA-binding MarR family transcriptional regulator